MDKEYYVECIDNLEFMKQIDDNKIDLIYCDILYGTGKNFKDYIDIKPEKKIVNNFYIPRIKEMYRILNKNGSIYLQMDYRISHWIRCILDNIFGYDNFKNEIIWKYGLGGSGKKEFAKKHDNILFYTKDKNYIFNLQHEPATSNKLKGKMKKMTDVWEIPSLNNMAKEREGYSTQKPKELLERIIKASSNEGDIVADFFCGSGTTAVVAKELNRKFIGCDISERAVKITKERLNKVLDK